MKTRFAAAVFTMLSISAFSQERLNKVSVNPLQLFGFNIVNFEYERGFNEGKLGVAFFYGRTGNTTRKIGDIRAFLTEQNVSVKSYSKSIDETSLWYGGQLSVASGDIIDFDDFDNSARGIGTLGITGKLGYQFILDSFYLDFFAGLGFAVTNDLFGTAQYTGDITESRVLPILGLKTGIAF